MRFRFLSTGFLLAALTLASEPCAQGSEPKGDAAAQSSAAREQARKLFELGLAAYKKKEYKEAVDRFLEADRIYPNPVLSFNAAKAYEEMSDAAGALRFYRSYLRLAGDAKDRDQVEKRVEELQQSLRDRGLQQVTIMSTPEAATVVIDGRPVGVSPWTGEIHPGKHVLELKHDGFNVGKKEFELPAHRAIDVELTLEPALFAAQPTGESVEPPPAAPAKDTAPAPVPRDEGSPGVRPLTWVAFGVGAAALGGAGVFEVLRSGAADDAKSEPTQVGRQDKIDEHDSRRDTARIFAIVGGAAVVAGGVLLYFDLSRKPEAPRAEVGAACLPGSCGAFYRRQF